MSEIKLGDLEPSQTDYLEAHVEALKAEIAQLEAERDELKAEQKESVQRFLVLWSKYWDLKNKQPKERDEWALKGLWTSTYV